ncbi:MAG: hypothetical protein L6R39_007331, partial [Caloplaca ligustica]
MMRAQTSCDGSVFDLPLLHTRPTAGELLSTLHRLQAKITPWDYNPCKVIGEEGLPRYLTSIVASPLDWIADDHVKEQVWEAASARLSERAGRSAMPSVSRTFDIPATTTTRAVSITLHEPSLTGDNLGHKTWLASFLLAKRLPSLLPYTPLSLPDTTPPHNGDLYRRRPRVLELGAGTGLVGITVAALFEVDLSLTDLPAIIPNLQSNVDSYLSNATSGAEDYINVSKLDWSALPHPKVGSGLRFNCVIAADPLYSPQHPAWLVAAIERFLWRDETARVVIELPLREAYMSEVYDFKHRMDAVGLVIEKEGLETGYEDWEKGNERTEVESQEKGGPRLGWEGPLLWPAAAPPTSPTSPDLQNPTFQFKPFLLAHISNTTVIMVFGLLTLAAIPTTIGVAEGISSTKKKDGDNEEEDPTVASTTEAQRMRKFRLRCYCDAPSSKAKEIDGGIVVLRDEK